MKRPGRSRDRKHDIVRGSKSNGQMVSRIRMKCNGNLEALTRGAHRIRYDRVPRRDAVGWELRSPPPGGVHDGCVRTYVETYVETTGGGGDAVRNMG